MAISTWRAYYERNFEKTLGGGLIKEKKELGQIQSISDEFPDAYYLLYHSNFNTMNGVTNYPAYNPGATYLKNFYTIFDMFTDEELSEFLEGSQEDFVTHANDNYLRFKVPSKIFWQGPNNDDGTDGMFFVPFLQCFQLGKGTNPNKINHSMYIGFGFLVTKWTPRYLGWNWIDGGDGLTYQNQPLIKGTDYDSVEGDAWINGSRVPLGAIYFNSIYNADQYDSAKVISRFSAFIKKLRCYPIFPHNFDYDVIVDGVHYYRYRSQSDKPTVAPGYNLVRMLYDLTYCPFVPVAGFSPNTNNPYWSNRSTMRTYHGFIVEVKTDGGPDPKDPDEKDDPNDDDDPPKPDDDGGDGDHDNTTDPVPPPGPPVISASGVGLLTIFNPTSSQLAALGAQLWNPTVLQALKQFFTEPTDAIIGLGIIPVQPRTGSSKNIHLGIYDTKVTAPLVDSDYVIKDCGSIPITRYYGSYLDYDPYTKISLYLPYIGEIDIDPDQVMQTNLGVEYHINVVTGDAVAIVTSNGSVIYTASGNCMRQIPIAQKDFSAIINTAVAAVSTIATAGVSAGAAKAVGGAVAGASKSEAGKAVADARTNAQLKNMEMGAGSSLIDQVMSSKFKYKHAGDIGGGAGQLAVQSPYLTIERPNLMLANNYKSYVGYPCNATLQLIRCKGFTQIEATRLSIAGATDEEITEALSYLVEGVII